MLKPDPAYSVWLQRCIFDGLSPFYVCQYPSCPESIEAFLAVVHGWVVGLSKTHTWPESEAPHLAKAFDLMFVSLSRFPVPANLVDTLRDSRNW